MLKNNKAHSLIRLKKGGFNVPSLFVCDITWTEESILSKIKTHLPNSKYFAVRSSADNEDSKDASFAGYFYTAIGVKRRDIFAEVLKVQKSYGETKGSVIIQEFISSDTAGVMFTKVGENMIVINANIGLCQSVVSGKECDEYLFNKNGSLVNKTIPIEKSVFLFKEGEIISEKSKMESLNESNINQLIKLGLEIQSFFGSPQDIEWCFKNDILYVLQSRPITRDFMVGKEEYFDSANIAESYSGVVLPLTCSFAKMVYGQVYKDLLRMSGVSRKKLEQHSRVFENLLGFFYGRMYYSMNNWYRMAEFFPGYDRNKKNFELMITSNIKQDVETIIKPAIVFRIFYPLIVGIKVAMFGITSARFKSKVERHLRILRNKNFDNLGYLESVILFENLNTSLLRRWYITLENDFFVMTYLGILKKILEEDILQKVITFPSKATEQVNALASLSRQMSDVKELWQAIEADDVLKFNNELEKNKKIVSALDSYLHSFGGRFANELKLESIGVDEDTKKLFAVLRAYQNYRPKEHITQSDLTLPFFKKIFVKMVVSKFRKYASRREVFRLLRSNTFGMTRRLFRHMGVLLTNKGVIENPEDIFYLQMEEITDPMAEINYRLAGVVKKRKEEYSSYANVIPPTHFSTINNHPPLIETSDVIKQQIIYARPASAGVIRGKVKVFKDFYMPTHVDFDILVTSHTDPGWTSLIALSKGLIIEHGGVLSHASIVARELDIPAVIGASNIVNTLTDYQMVEIDGSTGIIRLL